MSKIPVYDIDNGVPLSDEKPRVPLNLLDVGDSVLFPLEMRASVQSYASHIKRREGKQFTVKKVDDDNARVWRVR